MSCSFEDISSEAAKKHFNDRRFAQVFDQQLKAIHAKLFDGCKRLVDSTYKYSTKGLSSKVLSDLLAAAHASVKQAMDETIDGFNSSCMLHLSNTMSNSPNWYNIKSTKSNIFDLFEDMDVTTSKNSEFYNPFEDEARPLQRDGKDSPMDLRIKSRRLHASLPIGDSNIEANFNYHICRLMAEDYIFTGHEQSVRYNRASNRSTVIKHGIPLLFNMLCYQACDVFFPKNSEIILTVGPNKRTLKHRFRGSYLRDKWDNRSRGVEQIGCMVYFQAIPSDLIAINIDRCLSTPDDSYEGEKIGSEVEAFAIDEKLNIYMMTLDGRVTKHASSLSCSLDKSTEELRYDFTAFSKMRQHMVASYFVDKQKKTGFVLLNEQLQQLDEVELVKQSAHTHSMKAIDLDGYSSFISISFYTINLFTIVRDRLVPLDMNKAPSENMLNAIEYNDSTRVLIVVDTRRLAKTFRIE